MAEIADILDRAADKISAPGTWAQSTASRSYRTPHCIEFAVQRVAQDAGEPTQTCLGALYVVAPFTGVGGMIKWNDEPDRTQAEVVALLHKAAAKARGEPS